MLLYWFDSWAANTEQWDDKDKERKKVKFSLPLQAHLKVRYEELILDNLLIPLNSQMKNVFEILKAALKFTSKAHSMYCGNISIRQALTRGNFARQWSEKTKTVRIPHTLNDEVSNTQLTISILQSYRTTTTQKSSKWPGMGFSYIINKSDNTENIFRHFSP